MKYFLLVCFVASLILPACTPGGIIARSGKQLSKAEGFKNAHTGIAVFDVARQQPLFSYQADKYFIPASNTKIFTLYAGLKFLGDSLPGLKYYETADSFYLMATGDPSLLHPDFNRQPVIERLQKLRKPIVVLNAEHPIAPFGMGWAWDDYNSSYMAERSAMPVYGNVIRWIQSAQTNSQQELGGSHQTFIFSEPDVNWKLRFIEDTANHTFRVRRKKDENYFEVHQGRETLQEQSVPFITNGILSALELLQDTIGQPLIISDQKTGYAFQPLYSQPSDSVYKPMMHESDNFFAEQLLLMSANEKFRVMDEDKLIDHLLTNELRALPQRPRWVDGSGLSRYNLFSPADFVWVLNSMQQQYGIERLKEIFPGADEGTLSGYYSAEKGHIFAKTGTLSANVALSGFLITKKNRLLIFSILVNNHQTASTTIRRSIESFLRGIISNY